MAADQRSAASPPPGSAPSPWLLAGGLALLTVLVFGQVVTHEFLQFDDGQFVTENPHVQKGLTAESIRWAWTSARLGYYPLSWMSHMTDVSLFGLKAGGHLATSLLLHVASSFLLFFTLLRMTSAPLRSATVAALFAVHPMHVESVAWVSERRDTLSVLLGLLALLLYTMPRSGKRDVAVATALVASLLSKQMLVTMPFVLLLLDFWPLRRPLRVFEKVPLFLIAAGGVAVAIAGQRSLHAVQSTAVVPLGDRIANALVAYSTYIGKLLWPAALAPLYPLTEPSYPAAVMALLLMVALSLAAWSLRQRAPYLLVGWLWFAGTLLPVVGIVQIGAAGMADRYTYFPSIGLFVAVVWGAGDLLPRRTAAMIAAALVAVFSLLAFRQTRYWKNTETLFTHTLEVTGPNPIAEYTLGQSLQTEQPDRAMEHLRRAIALTEAALRSSPDSPKPDLYAQAHVGIGTALLTKAEGADGIGEKSALIASATSEYEAALRIDPAAANARRNLVLARRLGADLFARSEREAGTHLDAGVALAGRKKYEEAVAEYRQAVAANPGRVGPHVYLGIGLAQAGHNAEAVAELRRAESIDPARANRYVTGILSLPQDSGNLQRLLQQLGAR